ncbi:Actin-Related Protein 2/3 Complex Subunit 2 [Manis pentadactyla]|nr:Actin-Related Protein 2/3 Complex Subunit 2 [Manis pentadactyla]
MAGLELHVYGTGMTDIEVDGVGSETLALRKELGSWSDVTGSARCWNSVMGECEIQFQDYSEAIVGDVILSSCLRYGMTDIEADGVGSVKWPGLELALWKDLGSGSDMTGIARWWIRFMVMFADTNAKAEVSDTDARLGAGISYISITERVRFLV